MDGMRAIPSGSNLPTFFRRCLGGMAAFASPSGSGSASARDAGERILSAAKEVELECGDISASQEDLLARSSFLGGGGEEEAEVFSTPPLTQGPQSQQGRGDGEEEEDTITVCSLPFTQPSPSPPSLSSLGEKEDDGLTGSRPPRKPRVCTRKVRGARIRTPTPSPSRDRSGAVDPLYRAVLMIPTAPALPTAAEDLLALARHRGIF